ncbi:hypothetical protein ACN5ZK_05765 [Macrococcoides bohemicum]
MYCYKDGKYIDSDITMVKGIQLLNL